MAYNSTKGICYVLDSKGVCFIPIPKNASTTFRRECRLSGIGYRVDNFIENPDVLKNNKSFCFLREPVSRLVSGYMEVLIRTHDCPKTLEKAFYWEQEEPKRFLMFLKELNNGFYDAHIEPQSYCLSDNDDNLVKIDEILHIRDASKKFAELFEKSEESVLLSNRKNDSRKEYYKNQIMNNKGLLEYVKKKYKKDFEMYNELCTKENKK